MRLGHVFDSSHSRAASLTGSPMTVYSKRSLAPTLPATTWPAATPMPGVAFGHLDAQPLGHRARGRQRLVLGVVQRHGRTEDGEDGVTLELVDQPVVPVDLVDDHGEEPVEQFDHLDGGPAGDQLCRPDDVDEDHCGMAFFAAELRALLLGECGDLTADVPAEQIAHAFAFPQTVAPSS